MKTLLIFLKYLLELKRDIWALILILFTTPFFVLLYWLITLGGPVLYEMAILNPDGDRGIHTVVATLENLTYPSGEGIVKVKPVDTPQEGMALVRNGEALFVAEFPEGFSDLELPEVKITGDLSSEKYPLGLILFWQGVNGYVESIEPVEYPVEVTESSMGVSGAVDDFDLYVPGLLILAIIMVIYSSAFMTAREIESGTIVRLQMAPLKSGSLVTGISLAQLVTALLSLSLTLLTARGLGFKSGGPLLPALTVATETAFFCIGTGIIIGCFAKTVNRAFLIASVPFILLMFFSGSAFPLPEIELFSVAGRQINLFDFLPTTHAVNAMRKVFVLEAGFQEILYEMIVTLILSLIVYALGIRIFTRKYFSGVNR